MEKQQRIPNGKVVAPAAVELPGSAATGPTGRGSNEATGFEPRTSDLSRVQTAVASIAVGGIRRLVSTGTTVVHHTASSPPVRYVGDIAGEISAALAEDAGIDWRRAGARAEAQVERLFAVAIPVIVDFIDRIDLNALIEKVDIDAVIERVDIDAVMDRVDVAEISERIRVWNIMAKSSGAVAGSAVDVARDQGAGLGAMLGENFDRMRRQNPNTTLGPAQLDPEEGEEAK